MPRIPPEVLWEDGLFLRPHHLQAFQRHFHSLTTYLATNRPFGYGVRTLDIRKESIANWVFEINACDIVMPDGTVVIGGENAVLLPVEFRHLQFDAPTLEVWLAIPFPSENSPNMSEEEAFVQPDGSTSSRRYIASSMENKDENSGSNPQAIRTKRFNLRIFVGTRPAEGYATLKIAELKKVITDDEIGRRYDLSEDFVPASLTLESAPALHATVKDMLDRLEAKSADLLRPLRGNRAAQFGDSVQTPRLLMQLQATNGVLPILRQLVAQPGMHPFDVYLHMTRLAGDLAIVADEWEPPKLVIYDHDDPLRAFSDLKGKWLKMLEKAVDQRVDFVEFAPCATLEGVIEATLPDRFFSAGVDIFLGMDTTCSKDELDGYFSGGRTLLADPQDIPVLEKARIPGIACDLDAHIPADLSSRKGRRFLSIKQEGDQWNRVRETRRLGISGEVVAAGKMKFYLYATNVSGGDGG